MNQVVGGFLMLLGLAQVAFGIYLFVKLQPTGSMVAILGVVLVFTGAAIGASGLALFVRRRQRRL